MKLCTLREKMFKCLASFYKQRLGTHIMHILFGREMANGQLNDMMLHSPEK